MYAILVSMSAVLIGLYYQRIGGFEVQIIHLTVFQIISESLGHGRFLRGQGYCWGYACRIAGDTHVVLLGVRM